MKGSHFFHLLVLLLLFNEAKSFGGLFDFWQSPETTPCPFGTCNGTCCTEVKNESAIFLCDNGKEIEKTFVCNNKNDCGDDSDEKNCGARPPQITLLPAPKVDIYCGDHNEEKSGELLLYCEFAGSPELQIKWKKYEGHVPTKCQQSSFKGRGTLRCPKFKQADQGAYSCIAQNLHGLSESQPKSIAKCSNSIYCKGFTVTERFSNNIHIENCLECFCSGKSTQCHNLRSNVKKISIPFPGVEAKVSVAKEGEEVTLPEEDSAFANLRFGDTQEITYCVLHKTDLEESNFLKSYGRNINIPRFTGKTNFLTKAPDLIITGNSIALSYKFHTISHLADAVDVRFWPGNWHHLNGTVASRIDLMKVLSDVDSMFFRCEYNRQSIVNWKETADIHIESSEISEFATSASYLEKCNCPSGYEGLSCEFCAPGYKRTEVGNDFICEEVIKCDPCYTGFNCSECNKDNNCYRYKESCVTNPCHPQGSVHSTPNFDGKCTCKKNVVGDFCDECKGGFFNVEDECSECWCSGVTNECTSSDWYKTVISSVSHGGYNSSNGKNFWLLSENFNGNRLTSYGGYLNYTMRYIPNIPKQMSYLSVEFLAVDNTTIFYTHSDIDSSTLNTEKSWNVKLVEKYWKKSDESALTRGEFLKVLKKIKAIYIESPYHLASGKANLTSARMTSAEPTTTFLDSNEMALSVEKCVCPVGYAGLSCEKCDTGYYISRSEKTTKCVKCNCDNCDPEYGCSICPPGEYQVNEGKLPPVCKKCPCNGNEISCHKDVFGQSICICKEGYTGLYCENDPQVETNSYLDLRISPRIVKGQSVGRIVRFNCSYSSDEKLKLVVKKTYSENHQLVVDDVEIIPTPEEFESFYIFEFPLEEKLENVGCYVYDSNEKFVGVVKAIFENLIIHIEPVKITNCYSDVIEAKENEGVDLVCDAKGSPTPNIIWFRESVKGQMEKVDSFEGLHSVGSSETSLRNNGTVYTCMAENSVGSKDKCSKILIVNKKCDFVRISPKKLKVEEGDKITLVCRSTTKGAVSWSKLNGSLPFLRKQISGDTLNIDRAVASDSGTYFCTALSEGQEINDNATVVVKQKSVPPTVYIADDDKKLHVGDNYKVSCIGEGTPKPDIKWYKENEFLPLNVNIENNVLTINQARIENSGLYKCEGKSFSGSDAAYIRITVIENKKKPKIKLSTSSVKVVENEGAMVQCWATEGTPKPSLEWWKKAFGKSWVKHSYGDLLQFLNISSVDSGYYKCVGINSVGEDEAEVKIDVFIRPTVSILQDEVLGYENENVTVTCIATGYPQPIIHWLRRPSNPVSNFSYDTIFGSDAESMDSLLTEERTVSFTLSKDMKDTNIVCVAENEAGKQEASIPLKILHRTKKKEEVVERVLIGSTYEMTCESPYGNVTFKKEDGVLDGDVCLTPMGLYIPSVQTQHAGKYKCIVLGEEIKIINLIVVGFTPKFSRKRISYLVLPTKLNSSKNIRIEVSFKPLAETGVLLQNRNLEIFLKNRKVHLSLYSDKGVFETVLTKAIQIDSWYHLVVDVNSFIDVTMYDENTSIYERKTENSKDVASHNFIFEREDNVFIGKAQPETGMTKYSFKKLFLRKLPSFEGCISRLIVNNHEFDIVKEGSFSSNVTLCHECSQEKDVCEGKGKCFDAPTQRGFICVCDEYEKHCPGSCSKKGCETELDLCGIINPCKRRDLHSCHSKVSSLYCSCANGYEGITCEKDTENSFCSNGRGYVTLPAYLLKRQSLRDPQVFTMEFSLKKPDGVLLWQGDDKNHQYIVVENGILKYLHLSQKTELSAIGNTKLPLEEKLKMVIIRENNTVTMNVENEKNILFKAKSTSEFVTDRIRGNVMLGNLPNTTRLYNKGFVGFDGCIFSVSFNNQKEINLKESALELNKIDNIPKPLSALGRILR